VTRKDFQGNDFTNLGNKIGIHATNILSLFSTSCVRAAPYANSSIAKFNRYVFYCYLKRCVASLQLLRMWTLYVTHTYATKQNFYIRTFTVCIVRNHCMTEIESSLLVSYLVLSVINIITVSQFSYPSIF